MQQFVDSESKRRSRNESEKRRRDSFNILIGDLSALITVDEAEARKAEKSNVLQKTIEFLQKHNGATTEQRRCTADRPELVTDEEFCYMNLEASRAFVLVIDASLAVQFASSNCVKYLHYREDVLRSMRLGEFADGAFLAQVENVFCEQQAGQYCFKGVLFSSGRRPVTVSVEAAVAVPSWRRTDTQSDRQTSLRLTARCSVRGTADDDDAPVLPIVTVPAKDTEFSCTMNMRWRYRKVDDRCLQITGYSALDLLGRSGYDYIHPHDMQSLTECHKELLCKGTAISPAYRFATRAGEYIYLQARYYVTMTAGSNTPKHVDCTIKWISHPSLVCSPVPSNPNSEPPKQSSSTPCRPVVPAVPLTRPRPQHQRRGITIEHKPIVAQPQPPAPIQPLHPIPVIPSPRRASTLATLLAFGSSGLVPAPQQHRNEVLLQLPSYESSLLSLPTLPSLSAPGESSNMLDLQASLERRQSELQNQIDAQEREMCRLRSKLLGLDAERRQFLAVTTAAHLAMQCSTEGGK